MTIESCELRTESKNGMPTLADDQDKEPWIELPDHTWNIITSKFQGIAEGFNNDPFDSNECGYTDRIPFDIGTEVSDLPTNEHEQ